MGNNKVKDPTGRPVSDITCRDCGTVYSRPMASAGKRADGSPIWKPSTSVLCDPCRDKKNRKVWKENGKRQKLRTRYPASLKERPCSNCGSMHSRRRTNGLFHSWCIKCHLRERSRWGREQIEREVARRVKRHMIDYEKAKLARGVMQEMVGVMQYIAPNHDIVAVAEGVLMEWKV